MSTKRSPAHTESRSRSPWTQQQAPRRILVIRMHAIGDVAVTLPAIVSFSKHFPDALIDYLTTDVCAPMLEVLPLIRTVVVFPNHLNGWSRLAKAFECGWAMHRKKYDVVFDLQRNWTSRLIRRMADPQAWSEFDRFGPRAASDRVLACFHEAGFPEVSLSTTLFLDHSATTRAKHMLHAAGWTGTSRLVVLNPAGLWKTRQWPVDNYVRVARELMEREEVQFLLIGTERVRLKARHLVEQLGPTVLNLSEQTNLGEALSLLQFCTAVISEDSGLMHMAWASGIPSVALLGSTNHVWSAPTGNHVTCFHSGDLECGACMMPHCRHNDVHCLTRITPDLVLEALRELTARNRTPTH